jgi:hypothetical protein
MIGAASDQIARVAYGRESRSSGINGLAARMSPSVANRAGQRLMWS